MSEATPPFQLLPTFRRVWRLLTDGERRRTGWILAGILLNSVVDLAGLSVVIPVIGLVISPELIHENPWLHQAYLWAQGAGVRSEQGFLELLAVGLIAAFVFKAAFNFALNLVQTRFSFGVGHRMSQTMWRYHFAQSLDRMRGTSSGKVLEEINRWPLAFASMFIVGNLRFLNEVVVVALIVVGLLLYQPVVLVGVGLVVVTGAALIQGLTKRRLASYSDTAKSVEPAAETLINGAIRGIVEVLSLQASERIGAAYLRHTRKLYLTTGNAQVLSLTPAKLYEVLAVTGICLAILMSLRLGGTNQAFLNVLILMALSAYKILPSMTRMNAHLINLRAKHHLLHALEGALLAWKGRAAEAEAAAPVWERVAIAGRDVTCGYGDAGTVFEGLDFAFAPGRIHAVVGPSGSGKSTLLHAMLGLHACDAGAVLAGPDGGALKPLGEGVDRHTWLSHVAYVSQHPFLFEGTVAENLALGLHGRDLDVDAALALIRALNLETCLGPEPLAFRLFEGGSNLSGGQQQRFALLRALMLNRPVLVLDEATSALDEGQRDVVLGLLKAQAAAGVNVLLVTHDEDLAAQCDDVLALAGPTKA